MANKIPDFIETQEQAKAVIGEFLSNFDYDLLLRHRQAMIDSAHRASLAIMRGSGNELGPFEEFLSALVEHDIFTQDEAFAIGDKFIDRKHQCEES